MMQEQQKILDSSPAQLADFTIQATDNLPVPQRKRIAINAVRGLSDEDKKEVRDHLGAPGAAATDWIWSIIVGAFALVLVGAAGTLAVGRFIATTPATGAIYTSTDTILTIFTTASAFLIGLLVPSPVGKKGG